MRRALIMIAAVAVVAGCCALGLYLAMAGPEQPKPDAVTEPSHSKTEPSINPMSATPLSAVTPMEVTKPLLVPGSPELDEGRKSREELLAKSKEVLEKARQTMQTISARDPDYAKKAVQRSVQAADELLTGWGVPADLKGKVLEVIRKRDEEKRRILSEWSGGSLAPGDSTLQRYEAEEAATNEIKELLGAENAERFRLWEDSKTDRMHLDMMVKKGLALDEAQEAKLVDALYAARQKFKSATSIPYHGSFAVKYRAEVSSQMAPHLTPAQQMHLDQILQKQFVEKFQPPAR